MTETTHRSRHRRSASLLALALSTALVTAACSSDDDAPDAKGSAATPSGSLASPGAAGSASPTPTSTEIPAPSDSAIPTTTAGLTGAPTVSAAPESPPAPVSTLPQDVSGLRKVNAYVVEVKDGISAGQIHGAVLDLKKLPAVTKVMTPDTRAIDVQMTPTVTDAQRTVVLKHMAPLGQVLTRNGPDPVIPPGTS